MRRALALMATGVIVAAAACDTNQPTGGGVQTISVTASAFALTSVHQLYDIWLDTDNPPNGRPDVPTGDVRCVPTSNRVNAPVPWPYSASFSVIRAGTTVETRIASTVGTANPFTNLTPYETNIRRAVPPLPAQGKCLTGANIGAFCTRDSDCNPAGSDCSDRVFHFLNGREMTSSNREYLDTCSDISPLGESNILGDPSGVFTFEVEQGDTVVFRARKQVTAEAFPYDDILALNSQVFMSSSFFIDGRPVTPDGDTSSGGAEGGGYTASVGLR